MNTEAGGDNGMHGGWWSGHKVVDPADIETRYSQEDGLGFLEYASEELDAESLGQLERVRGILDKLPPCEADFIELYFFRRRKQTDIAEIFGVSQPTVCYRLQRATARARYLLSLPAVEEDEIEDAMKRILDDPLDISVMTQMFETTCQSEVAKRLGISQGKVRHRFMRAIDRMNDLQFAYEEQEHLLAMGKEEIKSFDAEDASETTWEEEVTALLVSLLGEDDALFFLHMASDGNVASATRRWGMTRNTLRRRYANLQERLAWFEGIGKYLEIFQKVSENLNILREVQRPSNERITHVLI